MLVFILAQGDLRRRQRAMEQAKWHAATLAERTGPGGALPLNLEPAAAPRRRSPMFKIEWLDREEARLLRKRAEPYVAAQTVPLLQVLAPDGRAVILFQDGRFDVKWLTLSEFDARFAEQQRRIRRPDGEPLRDSPVSP